MQTLTPQQYKAKYGENGAWSNQPTTLGRPTIGETIANSFKGGLNQIKEGFKEGVIDNNSVNPLKIGGNLLEGVGKVGSGAISAAFSPLAPVLNPTLGKATQFVGDKIAESPVVQKFAESKAGKVASRVAENTGNYSNIVGAVGGAMETPGALNSIKTGASSVADTAGSAFDSVVENVNNNAIKKLKGAPPTAESLAGKIVQGDVVDVARAKNVLSSIESTGIKTYKDLSKAIDTKISDIGSKIDSALETRPETINFKDLTYNNHNYAQDALSQLEDFYTKTNDIPKLKDVITLKNKAETQGLNIKEVNDLARMHGKELNAYNANGELASGLSKQAAENTRKGLKDTVRNYIDDPVFKAADKQLSDLINTKDLVNKISEKVNALQQRIQERGLLGKIGYGLGKVADLATGGGLKGLVNYFIPRGEGLKLLNALDLEKTLGKNLDLLKQLTGENITDTQIVNKLNSIIKEGSKQKLLPEPKPGTPKESINVPINQPSEVITNAADETTQNVKRVGGKGSRRSTDIPEGQASASAIKRGSYKQNQAYKARQLKRVVSESKTKTKP